MRRLKYFLIIFLILGMLGAGLTVILLDRTSSQTDAAGTPIDVSWNPVYIDNEAGSALSKTDLVDKVSSVVVSITTESLSYGTYLTPVPESGAASGVIIDPKGYIVTNNHVVNGAQSVTVTLSDGRSFDAVKWAGDSTTDLAVVEIQAGEDLPYAHFLSNSLEKLGLLDDVVAVGNALALSGGPTWTEGVVSYLGRSIQESTGVVLDDLIQTDAAINSGNSGGPLVNMAGQVVGINTAIASGAENIGFSISTDTAISTVYSLVTEGSVVSAWLGVNTTTVTQAVASRYGLSVDSGALIVAVVSGGPADTSGLRTADAITKFDSVAITDSQDLASAIQSHSPGDKVTITYVRGKTTYTTEVTLGQRPSS